MKKSLLLNWPLYAAVIVLLLLVWLAVNISIGYNRGHLVYALDDAYIHLAIAKHLSQSGVWGVTRYAFTPCSSSLLWTLLLSLTFYLGGVQVVAPLLWNLLFAILVLGVANAILCWYKTATTVKFAALLAIILLVPLPTLILSGMEQALQTLISLLAVFLAARLISGESPATSRRDAVGLLILAPLSTAVRFEGMFLVATLCALFLLGRRWVYAAALAVCGFLPVIINGTISVAKGWFWFPTSVLLKASLPDHSSLGAFILSVLNPAYRSFSKAPQLLALRVAVLVVYIVACRKGSGPGESRQIMGAILVLTGMAHIEFVGWDSLFRYEAYWDALAILYLVLQLPVVVPRWPSLASWSTWTAPKHLASGALALLLFFPLAMKGGLILWLLPQCTKNIFEQQYQMGRFVQRYYQNSSVGLNDIGAVNFLADIHCLDLWGLANAEVARLQQKHAYYETDIDRLAQQSGARIAIIYDDVFPGMVPPTWIRVGRWTIQNDVVAGRDTVSFYAVNPAEAAHLSECLQDFSSQLPADVIQRGQ